MGPGFRSVLILVKKKEREKANTYENLSEMKNYCKMQVVNIANN